MRGQHWNETAHLSSIAIAALPAMGMQMLKKGGESVTLAALWLGTGIKGG
jgi:hypothetical protein